MFKKEQDRFIEDSSKSSPKPFWSFLPFAILFLLKLENTNFYHFYFDFSEVFVGRILTLSLVRSWNNLQGKKVVKTPQSILIYFPVPLQCIARNRIMSYLDPYIYEVYLSIWYVLTSYLSSFNLLIWEMLSHCCYNFW